MKNLISKTLKIDTPEQVAEYRSLSDRLEQLDGVINIDNRIISAASCATSVPMPKMVFKLSIVQLVLGIRKLRLLRNY